MKSNRPLLLFSLLGFAVGGGLLFVRMHAMSRTEDAQSWDAVPCTIESAEWIYGDDNEHSFDLTYSYEVDGKSYTSTRLDLMTGVSGDPLAWYRQLEEEFPAGSQATCFVNPQDATDAVLDRDHALEGLWGLGVLATIFMSIGIVFLSINVAPNVQSLIQRIVVAVVQPNSRTAGANRHSRNNNVSGERRFSYVGAIVYALGEPKGGTAIWAFFLAFAFIAGIVMDGRGMLLDLIPVHDLRTVSATVIYADRKTGHEFGSPNFEFTFRYEVDGTEYESTSMAAGRKFAAGESARAEYQVSAPDEARLLGARPREVPTWVLCLFGSVPALMGFMLLLIPLSHLKSAWQGRKSEEFAKKMHVPDYVYRRDPVEFANAIPSSVVPIVGWAILIAMFRFY